MKKGEFLVQLKLYSLEKKNSQQENRTVIYYPVVKTYMYTHTTHGE